MPEPVAPGERRRRPGRRPLKKLLLRFLGCTGGESAGVAGGGPPVRLRARRRRNGGASCSRSGPGISSPCSRSPPPSNRYRPAVGPCCSNGCAGAECPLMRIPAGSELALLPVARRRDKSNRLLMEALAAREHICRAVARIPRSARKKKRGLWRNWTRAGSPGTKRRGSGIRARGRGGSRRHQRQLRAYFDGQVETFRPDVILASTDDPAQVLLEAALARARRPDRLPSAGHHRIALWAGLRLSERGECAAHSLGCPRGGGQRVRGALHPRLRADGRHARFPFRCWKPGIWPALGCFDNEFVTIVNLARSKASRFSWRWRICFGRLPSRPCPPGEPTSVIARRWPNPERSHSRPVDDIGLLLARTCVLLAPSCGPRRGRASWWRPCCTASR